MFKESIRTIKTSTKSGGLQNVYKYIQILLYIHTYIYIYIHTILHYTILHNTIVTKTEKSFGFSDKLHRWYYTDEPSVQYNTQVVKNNL